ncbi:MAG: transglutaminase-like domain-containing protein [Candidatus Alcyoniella australis]|nr:transglutaminase-like domain-containing protein [Candidatus Alcyoniella australis]
MSFSRSKRPGLVKISIVLFWVAMTALMIVRERAAATDPVVGGSYGSSALSGDESWMGMYYKDKTNDRLVKIGYSVTSKKQLDSGWLFSESGRMKINVQGSTQTIRTDTRAITDADYLLRYFQFEMISDLVKFKLDGRVEDGNKILLNIETGGGTTRKETIDLDQAPAMQLNIMDRLLALGLEQGKSYELPFFDPSTMSNETITVQALGLENVEDGGKTLRVWHLQWDYKGIAIDSWIDERGNSLREETDTFLTVRESREKALGEGWDDSASLDLVREMAVPVSTEIPNPRKAERMQVKIAGVPFDTYPLNDWRQRAEFGELITVQIENLDEIQDPYILPYRGEELTADLAATAMIQSDHPAIRNAAKDIIGDQTDPLRAARKINDWVHDNLKKEPVTSIPSAYDVLIIKKGDCNEHTVLTVALARAAGIPARVLVGLVYHQGAFYYHAWPAVWVGRWVAIEPTFGQFPADATHIKLLEGDLDKQVDLIQIMGKVRIEVMDVK